MTNTITFLLCSFLSLTGIAHSPVGVWEAIMTAENGDEIKSVVIFAEGYQVLSIYNNTTGEFYHSNGGTWKLEGDTMTEMVEFDTDDADNVGTEVSFKIAITDNSLELIENGMKFRRIDDGEPGALQGAWLIAGRLTDGETQLIDTNRSRKTMKILSGTRFQWIAYDTETKEFMGTGGGTYSTENGEYRENIEFFSRDDSKVGLNLIFKYELIDGNWHHSGSSSKGDPIHEIWSRRE